MDRPWITATIYSCNTDTATDWMNQVTFTLHSAQIGMQQDRLPYGIFASGCDAKTDDERAMASDEMDQIVGDVQGALPSVYDLYSEAFTNHFNWGRQMVS